MLRSVSRFLIEGTNRKLRRRCLETMVNTSLSETVPGSACRHLSVPLAARPGAGRHTDIWHSHANNTHTFTSDAQAAKCPWHEHYCGLTGRHLKAPTLKPTLQLAVAPNKRQCVCVCVHVCTGTSNFFPVQAKFKISPTSLYLNLPCTVFRLHNTPLPTTTTTLLWIPTSIFEACLLRPKTRPFHAPPPANVFVCECACANVPEREGKEALSDDTVKSSVPPHSWQITRHASGANFFQQMQKQGRFVLSSRVLIGTEQAAKPN